MRSLFEREDVDLVEISRQGFLDLFAKSGNMKSLRVRKADIDVVPSSGNFVAVFSEPMNRQWQLPCMVVSHPGESREFLAWTATYLDSIRPFTAYCRVVDGSLMSNCFNLTPPELGRHAATCAGVVLAELLGQANRRFPIDSFTISAIQSTYSFCRAKALFVGFNDPLAVEINWRKSHDLLGRGGRQRRLEGIHDIWNVLDALIRREKPEDSELLNVVDACNELNDRGFISRGRLESLGEGIQLDASILEKMADSRESRVVAFEQFISQVREKRVSYSPRIAFLSGYLASLLNPGSTTYVDLVQSYEPSMHPVLMWYFVCSGLNPESKLQNEYRGLIRRIMREIVAPGSLLEPPRCDLAIDELELLLSDPEGIRGLPVGNQSQLNVEVAPLISTIVRFEREKTPEQKKLFLDGMTDDARRSLVRKFGRIVNDLGQVYGELTGELPSPKAKRKSTKKRK